MAGASEEDLQVHLDRNSFLAGLVAGLALSYIILSAVVMLAPRGRPADASAPAATPSASPGRSPTPTASLVASAPPPSATPDAPTTHTPTSEPAVSSPATATPTGAPSATPSQTATPVPPPTATPTAAPTNMPRPTDTPVSFQEQRVEVPPRKAAVIRIPAEEGQTLDVTVTVDAEDEESPGIEMVLMDARDRRVLGPERVSGTYSFQQVSRRSGEWVLRLENSVSRNSSKQVMVRYRVY